MLLLDDEPDLNGLPLEEVCFVVVDVETTGGASGSHRMTEVAACVVENGEITHRYSSLINPHMNISQFVTVLTGITNEMVQDAPDEDIAIAPLAAMLRQPNTVFVAHNVGFDWQLVSDALDRCNESVDTLAQLCTCKLSRRIVGGRARHDLGSVASFFEVGITNRHRALGDCDATAAVLLRLIAMAVSDHGAATLHDLIQLQWVTRVLPVRFRRTVELLKPVLSELPDEPGVYYLLNRHRQTLYVGKAVSVSSRVRSYFSGLRPHNRTLARMLGSVRHISWQATETELSALLLEAREIADLQPICNRLGVEPRRYSFLHFTDEPCPRLQIVRDFQPIVPACLGPFRSRIAAEKIKDIVERMFGLRRCNDHVSSDAATRPCLDFHIGRCGGPCSGLQSQDEYRHNVQRARRFLSGSDGDIVSELTVAMTEAAERLDFEFAALVRDCIAEVRLTSVDPAIAPFALEQRSLIIVSRSLRRPLIYELFIVERGCLKFQEAVRKGDKVIHIAERAVSNSVVDRPANVQGVEDVRIISSWLFRNRKNVKIISIRDKSVTALVECIEEGMQIV